MSMFDKYENNSYTAYNLTPRKVSYTQHEYFSSPIVEYDLNANIKSFMWDPLDEFELKLRLGKKIKVFEDSIIYNSPAVYPTNKTKGNRGQRAYNTADGISWICKGTLEESINEGDWEPITGEAIVVENFPEWMPLAIRYTLSRISSRDKQLKEIQDTTILGGYIWEKDLGLAYPNNGTKEILIAPDMSDKDFYITISNFRHEVLYEFTFTNSNSANIAINSANTPLLVEGQYFINLIIKSANTTKKCARYPITIIDDPISVIKPKVTKVTHSYGYTIQQNIGEYEWESLDSVYTKDDNYYWQELPAVMTEDTIWSTVTGKPGGSDYLWSKM